MGKKWPARDYARLLAEPGLPDQDVALVFHSMQDGLYKFAFVTRIRDGDRVLGLLAATVPTDARMLGLDLNDEPAGALVACPFDPTYSDTNAELGAGDWVVVLHRDYTRPGQRPARVGADRETVLEAFAADPARVRNSGLTAGGVADAARIGRTRYVVLIENPRPWLLGALGDVPWGWWPALAAALVGAGLLVGFWRRRARVVP